jgi:gamma-glutamyltranspeptidase/glutathione hydrolase
VAVELSVETAIVDGLRERGHDVKRETSAMEFGRAQIIFRLPEGGYLAGSEMRADGQAVGY